MTKNNNVIVFGWINHGKTAECGETVKNQQLISRLIQLGYNVIPLDFYRWKHKPFVLLKLIYVLLFKRCPIIVSTSAKNAYPLFKLHHWLNQKRCIIHWVIGGAFHNNVRNKTFNPKYIKSLNINIVESPLMLKSLNEDKIDNVIVVPNFKRIHYFPSIKVNTDKRRYIFISRIMPEKGVNYILNSASILNQNGLSNKYEIDFYGKIDSTYQKEFERKIENLPNVCYKGFINLRDTSNYDLLSNYDFMLFPTFWKGEGFAGIFIDAFISGVPIIASRWGHNELLLKEGENALFIDVHNQQQLTDVMVQTILMDNNKILKMKQLCQNEAHNYEIENIITQDFLISIGL